MIRLVICNNDSIECLLPEWLVDMTIAERVAKWMEFEYEARRAKEGFQASECKGYFHVHQVYVSPDSEIGEILHKLLKD